MVDARRWCVLPIDIYKIARGYKKPLLLLWISIHTVIVVTGVLALRTES